MTNIRRAWKLEVLQIMVYEGEGTEDDPGRIVAYYFLPDGRLLAINDPIYPHPSQKLFAQVSEVKIEGDIG
jgi:hypothetical protein